MAKTILEYIAENSLKHPILGVVASVIFLCIGIYLNFSHGPSGPAGAMFSGFNKMFAYFFYGLSAFAAVFAAIGYVKNKVGKKQRLNSLNQRKPCCH